MAHIILDLRNPRFEALNSERDAVNALINDDPKKICNLAEDILAHGLNPSELPIVQRGDGAVTVLEGNRRFAALKLLRDPALSDDAKVRSRFAQLSAAKGVGPDEVLCQVVSKPDDARHWIELRHSLKVKPGVSVVPWSPEQRARFGGLPRRDQTSNAVAFCDAIAEEYSDDQEILAALGRARSKSVTNIGRMVSDPEVRNALGFGWLGSGVESYFERDEARPGFLRLLNFLAEHDVNAIRNKEDRRAFIHGDAKVDWPDQRKRLDSPIPLGSVSEAARSAPPSLQDGQLAFDVDSGNEGISDQGKGLQERGEGDIGHASTSGRSVSGLRHDGARLLDDAASPIVDGQRKTSNMRGVPAERKIFESVKLRNVSLGTRSLLKEAQTIRIDDAPRVCAILVRVVVEVVATEVGEQCNWFPDSDSLAKKISKSIRKLDPECDTPRRNLDLHPAYTKSDPGAGGLAVKDLNSYVHHFRAAAASNDVRAHSLVFGPLVQALDDHLGRERSKR